MNGFETDVTRVYDLADVLAKSYKSELVNADAVATGSLADFSYDVDMRESGLSIIFELPDYWFYIEEGRKPTMNSGDGSVLQRIRQWIDDKGIVPVPDASGHVPTLDDLAYVITRKIHRVGYFDLDGMNSQGKHPLGRALDRNEDVIDSVVDECFGILSHTVLTEIDSLGEI